MVVSAAATYNPSKIEVNKNYSMLKELNQNLVLNNLEGVEVNEVPLQEVPN